METDETEIRFRKVLIDILHDLSDVDRKKLAFLLGKDIERRLRDNATVEGTLDIFQQLFDKGKISGENFSYLIDAFHGIKCYEVANRLKIFQINSIRPTHFLREQNQLFIHTSSEPSATTTGISYNNNQTNHLIKEMFEDGVVIKDPMAMQNIAFMTEQIKADNDHHGLCHRRKYPLIFIISAVLFVAINASLLLFFLRKSSPVDPTVSITNTTSRTYYTMSTTVPSASENSGSCTLPLDKSCTASTPDQTKAEGLGVFYQFPCSGVGCNFYRPFCRLCAKHSSKINDPYVKCPECVPDWSMN